METQPQVLVPANRRGDRAAGGHQVGSGAATSWTCDTTMTLRYRVAGVDYEDQLPASQDKPVEALVWQTTEADTQAAGLTLFNTTAARWKVFSIQQRATPPAIGTARLYVIQEARWADLAGTLDVLPIVYNEAPNKFRLVQVLGGCVPFVRGRQVISWFAGGASTDYPIDPPNAQSIQSGTLLGWADHALWVGEQYSFYTFSSSMYRVVGTTAHLTVLPGLTGDFPDSPVQWGVWSVIKGLAGGPAQLLQVQQDAARDTTVSSRMVAHVPHILVGATVDSLDYSKTLTTILAHTTYTAPSGWRITDLAGAVVSREDRRFDIPGLTVANGDHWRLLRPTGIVRASDGTCYASLDEDFRINATGAASGVFFVGTMNVVVRVPAASGAPITVLRYQVTLPPSTTPSDPSPRQVISNGLFGGVALLVDNQDRLYILNTAANMIERYDPVLGGTSVYLTYDPTITGATFVASGPLTSLHLWNVRYMATNGRYLDIRDTQPAAPVNGHLERIIRIDLTTDTYNVISTSGRTTRPTPLPGGDFANISLASSGTPILDTCGNFYTVTPLGNDVPSKIFKYGCAQNCRS